MRCNTANAEETLRLGRWIGGHLTPGAVVGLDGGLGAGKTWLAKGIVRGLGEYDQAFVKSPAYNLVHEYELLGKHGPLSVFHMDFYRLDELSPDDAMLFGEYFENPDAVFLVEWAQKFLGELVRDYLSIQIGPDPARSGADHREIRFQVKGETRRYASLIEELPRFANTHH